MTDPACYLGFFINFVQLCYNQANPPYMYCIRHKKPLYSKAEEVLEQGSPDSFFKHGLTMVWMIERVVVW